MARPTTITNEQILDAARAVFTERGLAATTAEIAARAGCSEGSIFRRFPTKQDLFLEAMGVRNIDSLFGDVDDLVGSNTLAENLATILNRKIDFYLDLMPRILVLVGCGVSAPDLMRSMDAPPPLRSIRRITDYLAAEQDAGRLFAPNHEVLARMLIGAAHFYAFTNMTGINDRQPMPRETFVTDLVETLLRGVAVER